MQILRALAPISLLMLATASPVGAQAAKQPQGAAAEIPEIKAESVGFSSERLSKLDAGMKSLVDTKKVAGMVTILWLVAPGAPDVENLSRALTYQALVNPNK
jgi:hypothetical protein